MNKKPRILVVDDLPENIIILEAFLQPMGFDAVTATDGEEALKIVDAAPPDLILLDLMMPGLSGFDVCSKIKKNPKTRHIPIIVVTGVSDRSANIKAVEAGADDYLIKPFDRVLLEARIRASLRTKALQDQIFEYQQDLENKVSERTREVLRTQEVSVFCMAKLAESRDNETGDHVERVRLYAKELSTAMATLPKYAEVITTEFIDEIYKSSPLHDIGKVGIPDRILLKPGKLSAFEFDTMKSHARIGGDTLRAADLEAGGNSFLTMARDIAYHHHEKWNGQGYPNGLSGEDIPLAARMVALADVYDALSSKRPYKEPFSHEKSKAIVLEGRDEHFDPGVVDAFLAKEEAFIAIREKYQGDGAPSPIQVLVDQLEEAGYGELET